MRRADRLIRIVHFLRGRRQAVTAKRIAEEFEICTRTVYRDIQDLMNSGAPINGEAGVGYMIDKQYYLPPVTFDAEELEAIGLGISMVRQWTDQRFAEKADSAFGKIQAVLPANLSQPIPSRTSLPCHGLSAFQICATVFAFAEKFTSAIPMNTLRILRPLALIFCSPVWLLATWCEKRSDFRNFRLDRIRSVGFREDTFEDEKDKNLSAYKVQDALC